MKCIFIRWDQETSDFTYDDFEKSYDIYKQESTTYWEIPKELNPQIEDACIVCCVDKQHGGHIVICGFVKATSEISETSIRITVKGYFTDLDCYPLLYESDFSKLTKPICFDEGPDAELMDDEIVFGFHLIILRKLAKFDIFYYEQSVDFFDGAMKNIVQALIDD